MSKFRFKKNLIVGVSALVLSFTMIFSLKVTTQACEVVQVASTQSIAPRSAIIDWRYKGVDGRLYRRLYNYTEQCWIGEWELCP